MTFKTILVNLNNERRVPELIAAAAAIARPAQAHVVGLYVTLKAWEQSNGFKAYPA